MKEQLLRLAIEAGASKAEMITSQQIVLSAEFREACQKNICGRWGKCWMCPPDIGDIAQLMEKIGAYGNGIWYQSIHALEDSFDIEGMIVARRSHLRLSHQLEGMIKPLLSQHLHLSCGGCGVCQRCAREDHMPCRFPEQAMSSLEAYGIDVYRTTVSTQLFYINGQNTVTYFGVILF